MITLTDSIEITATPEKIFEWLVHLKEREDYRAWHPDQVDFRWIKGEPFEEGSIVYFEEYIHGKLHKAKFLCTKAVSSKVIEYKPLFPWSIFMPKGSFVVEPKGADRCIFIATINVRLGPLFRKFGKKRIESVKQHMKEEGENLKRTLEKEKER